MNNWNLKNDSFWPSQIYTKAACVSGQIFKLTCSLDVILKNYKLRYRNFESLNEVVYE